MTQYEMGKYWLLHTLETYRDTPPEATERKFIDRLIVRSRNAAGSVEEKKYHNLIVLRYITNTRPSMQRICAALQTSRNKASFEAITGHAIDRLLVLAFGIAGINWQEAAGPEPSEK